jgi:TolB-like protein
MTDSSPVEVWLDQWEEWRGGRAAGSADEFVALRLHDQPAGLVASFLQKAWKLERIDRELARAGTPGQSAARELAAPELAPGAEPVPGYRLEAPLGKGGFGEVWRAAAPGGVPVALKFVRLGREVGSTEMRALEIIKYVRHPHLLGVSGAWEVSGWLVVAMELADRTLAERLREAAAAGPPGIPRDELLGYMADAAEGLDYLNEPRHPAPGGTPRGIQHRDVKPQNLLLVGGRLKVGDYGLARVLDRTVADHTGSKTYAYAPPECFNGTMSAQSDQYSLAVTYCHLRGGRVPFDGTPAEVMFGHLNKEPELSMLPPEERPAVARALAKSPADRWPSCGAFVAALAEGRAAPVRPGSTAVAPLRGPGRVGRLALGLVVPVAAAATGTWLAIRPAPVPAGSGGPTARTAAQPGEVVAVAVLDFENHSNDPRLDGFRLGLRDMLVTDLSRIGAVRVTERARLGAVLGEHDLARAGGFIDPATANPGGRGVAARLLLTGGFVVTGEDVRVDVRLVSVETGVVTFADTVAGTKSDFAGLQKALAERIVAGLRVDLTDDEKVALGRSHTGDFEAFRLYTAARLAREREQAAEAEGLLRQALARDPKFGLARRELGDLKVAALTRLAGDDRRRLERAGAAGRALLARRGELRAALAAGRGPAYFAALISLSAHAGLLGDTAREAELLDRFWAEFTSAVPAGQSARVGAEINRLVMGEGKFFQEQVDGGEYATFLKGFSDPQEFLKSELRGALRWPRYAAIWPFDFDAREAFRVVSNDRGVKVDPAYFERSLPQLPHDYLRRLLAPDSALPANSRLRLLVAVAGYYSRGTPPPGSAGEVTAVQRALLGSLARVQPAKLDPALAADAAAVLNSVGAAGQDAEVRRRANELVLRFARFGPTPADSKPAASAEVSVFGLKLDGPRVVLVIHRESDFAGVPVGQAEKLLAAAIRELPDGVELDVVLAGRVKKAVGPSLFGGVRPLTGAKREEAATLVENLAASLDATGYVPRRPLAAAFAAALDGWPAGNDRPGQILVVNLADGRPAAPRRPIRIGPKAAGRPRVLFAGVERVDWVGRAVRDTGGAAVLLEVGEFLRLRPTRWDVSQLK